jgi:mono/diheme cytochrome c family protein
MKPVAAILFAGRFARATLIASCLSGIVCAGAGIGFAQDSGKTDFLNHCAGCHGADGKGKGPSLYVIGGIVPSDLTQLSKRNGGPFPFKQVEASIDGRGQIPSHKRFDMPFWGVRFQEPGNEFSPESEAKAKARIAAIVHYIETLQRH